jgi:hypothetical protein
MNKIKKVTLASTILVCISMSAIMPVGMILFKFGFCDDFAKMWFKDFLLSCCIAIPSGLIVVPMVEKLVKLLVSVNGK